MIRLCHLSEKVAAMKRFEYSSLSGALKKQTNAVEKQYQKLDKRKEKFKKFVLSQI